jgi:hypothetical protein
MADIDLKTLSPDTSLPTTGFLFGADSQASTNPSVYSTQTVATTLLGSTSLTGDTLTADAPVLNLTQTWNSSGVTFTGVRFNAAGSSSTNSAAASLLMDLQVGGTSLFSVRKDGSSVVPRFAGYRLSLLTSPALSQVGGTLALVNPANGIVIYTDGSATEGSGLFALGGFGAIARNSGAFGFDSNSSANGGSNSSVDLWLTRKGAANLRFGAADAASPVAQTLSVQSVVAGATTNTPGADFTINGSQGIGSGVGGSIIFKVAPAGTAANPAQNTLADALTITSNRSATFANSVTVASDIYTGRYLVLQSNNVALTAPSNGVGQISTGASPGTGFGRLQFGGATSSFPALKRSTTALQAVLADDTGFTNIQGKLTTDNAYTAGTVVQTGYVTIYDSTGTAYKVLVGT